MKIDAAEQAEIDAIIAKVEAEDAAEAAAVPGPTSEVVRAEAAFLAKWSKGKLIRHQGATFYASGKWMTKLSKKMVTALFEGGYAVGSATAFTVKK